jgi:hypothetical protein
MQPTAASIAVHSLLSVLAACRDYLVQSVATGSSPATMVAASVCAAATRVLAKVHVHIAGSGRREALEPTQGLKDMMVCRHFRD